MAWKIVDKYCLGYNLATKQFYFYYQLQGETTITQFFPSAQEFIALADMFRNEGPISYNTDGNYFVTAPGAVGEGETPG
jgi:hypothetical protein